MTTKLSVKRAALLICLLFCLSVALSGLYVALHADHHCSGEECTVCAELAVCVTLLGTTAVAAAIATSSTVFPRPVSQQRNRRVALCAPHSLISLKVKLSN